MIAVLLATFNSGKYIRGQIDSILSQTYTDWKLFVHDDGSTDDTLDILREYIQAHPGTISFIQNAERGLGACGSFLSMQEEVESDHYMFCDHDDVWLPDKMEISFRRMQELECAHPGLPVVVHTDMKVVDDELKVIADSFWQYMKLLPDHCSFAELAVCHCVNGCTILFNRKANLLALKGKSFALMHDVLLSESVAAAGGIISPIHRQTVLYRQHGDNVLGAQAVTGSSLMGKFLHLKGVFRKSAETRRMANRIQRISWLRFLFTKFYMEWLRLFRYRRA